MTIVRLPDEHITGIDKTASVFYSTKPLDIDGFLREVGGLDLAALRGNGWESRPLALDEAVRKGDVLLVNPNSGLHPELPVTQQPRTNYVISEEIQNGYKIRELPVTLLFEHDLEELERHLRRP